MQYTKILDLENDGLNMAADERHLYVRRKREMIKYDLCDMRIVAQNAIFKKDGMARNFSLCDEFIYLTDFCDLYILDHDLSLIEVKRLGSDLSSDLGMVRFDAQNAYISIRNGKMAVCNLDTRACETKTICDSSSWDFCVADGTIYTGAVNGEIVKIDCHNMQLVRRNMVCGKNIYSVVYDNGMLYTVSQDRSIKLIDATTLEVVQAAKNAVKGMVRMLGLYKDNIVIADGGISLWDKQALKLISRYDFPTGRFNKGALLHKDTLYGSDFCSIYSMAIS